MNRAWLIALASGLALALIASLSDGAGANSRTKDFVGNGSGASVIANPEECELTGRCRLELSGEFDVGEMGAGTVSFIAYDDWSDVTGQHGSCSAPTEGETNFIWETTEGDGLAMTQTVGFVCPSANGDSWRWKRVLRIVEGTGKFDGVVGSVFISGSRDVETGEETWTINGSITYPREQRDGCYRAYFIGDLILIPPKNTPPPVTPSLSFWLCGDDVRLQWPNPREDYEIFNPLE